MTDVVQTLWGFCHTLRHDGIDYGDYIEQITYLLFLKMADERAIALPEGCGWPALSARTGTDLSEFYTRLLGRLGKEPGILGDIFAQAQNRFANPVSLKRLIGLVDQTEWTALDVDVKGAAFEGLLEKAASEGKKGAGQYFTPRVLIQAIVRCMKPDPRAHPQFTICDPACGTGGFLISAHDWLLEQTDGVLEVETARRVKRLTYYGQDLVQRPRRLALMNLFLHNLEPVITLGDSIDDPPSSRRYDAVLTNPPFGTKGANAAPEREDFVVSTSNKQLNFIQHVMTILKPGGRAAVVVPDNVLFADAAGDVFKVLVEDCDLHTVLRLPDGTFSPYSPGTKTNVIFFTKGYPTERTWVYDGRTNVPGVTKKGRPLTAEHFAEFERCYGTDPNGRAPREATDSAQDRWQSFHVTELREHDFKVDGLMWLRDEGLGDGGDLPEPALLAGEAIAELEAAVEELQQFVAMLENDNGENGFGDVLLDAACDGKLTEDWRGPNSSPWSTIALEECGMWVGGITPSKGDDAFWENGTIPWITPKDMKRDVLFDAIDHITQHAMDETTIHLLPAGSVIFVVRGMILARNFPVAVVERPFTINQDIRGVIPNDRVDGRFLMYALKRDRNKILGLVKSSTHGTKRIESPDLKKWIIPLPPLPEQEEIVRRVEALIAQSDKIGGSVAAALERVEALAQAVLAKAFRGEPVPTEAELARREGREYEPAGALLERVRAGQTATAPVKSPRRQKGAGTVTLESFNKKHGNQSF